MGGVNKVNQRKWKDIVRRHFEKALEELMKKPELSRWIKDVNISIPDEEELDLKLEFVLQDLDTRKLLELADMIAEVEWDLFEKYDEFPAIYWNFYPQRNSASRHA